MGLSGDDVKKAMANKTDEELYDAVYVRTAEYTSDAIEAAKLELSSRNLGAAALADLRVVTGDAVKQEGASLSWPLRFVAFFISTMFLFIPLLLAHRHYIEQGAKRKARDWARWALLGFLFYAVLGVVLRLSN